MECEYCQKVFSTKSNLSSHQKSAKYCLELQGEHKEEKNFKCEYCNKVLTQQKSLDVHIISCKEKKKKNEMMKDTENSLLIKKLEYENESPRDYTYRSPSSVQKFYILK